MNDTVIGNAIWAIFGSSVEMIVGAIVGATLLLLLFYWFYNFLDNLFSRIKP